MKTTITQQLPLARAALVAAFLLHAASAQQDRCAPPDASDAEPIAGVAAAAPAMHVQSYDYDPMRQELLLVFADGCQTRCFGVPKRVYEEFNLAADKNAYANRVLLGDLDTKQSTQLRKPQAEPPRPRPKADPHQGGCTRHLYLRMLGP